MTAYENIGNVIASYYLGSELDNAGVTNSTTQSYDNSGGACQVRLSVNV